MKDEKLYFLGSWKYAIFNGRLYEKPLYHYIGQFADIRMGGGGGLTRKRGEGVFEGRFDTAIHTMILE